VRLVEGLWWVETLMTNDDFCDWPRLYVLILTFYQLLLELKVPLLPDFNCVISLIASFATSRQFTFDSAPSSTSCLQGKSSYFWLYLTVRFSSQTSQRQRLFANYDDSRASSQSPHRNTSNYTPPAFAAYPSPNGYREATPNSKGQYSDAVLSELESQNDDEMAGMVGKVKRLKDVGEALYGATNVSAYNGNWRRNPRFYKTCWIYE
jgi:hypothetical protein